MSLEAPRQPLHEFSGGITYSTPEAWRMVLTGQQKIAVTVTDLLMEGFTLTTGSLHGDDEKIVGDEKREMTFVTVIDGVEHRYVHAYTLDNPTGRRLLSHRRRAVKTITDALGDSISQTSVTYIDETGVTQLDSSQLQELTVLQNRLRIQPFAA